VETGAKALIATSDFCYFVALELGFNRPLAKQVVRPDFEPPCPRF